MLSPEPPRRRPQQPPHTPSSRAALEALAVRWIRHRQSESSLVARGKAKKKNMLFEGGGGLSLGHPSSCFFPFPVPTSPPRRGHIMGSFAEFVKSHSSPAD